MPIECATCSRLGRAFTISGLNARRQRGRLIWQLSGWIPLARIMEPGPDNSRIHEMKFQELERFALRFLNLVAVPSGQAMFGSGDLMKLKGHAVPLQFLRHHS